MRCGKDGFGGIWLLWAGIGLGALLASLEYHWFVSQSVMLFFISLWCWENINPKLFLRGVLFTAADVFFKDFDVAGQMRVPDDGPVILACAPHANQFVDPIVVAKAINSRKDIGFLAAASTMRKKYIGSLAKVMQSIPVERPQDLATLGDGTIEVDAGSHHVKGTGTHFTAALKPGYLIAIHDGLGKNCTSRVTSIESDTMLTLKRPFQWPRSATSNSGVLKERLDVATYKIHPLLDQSSVFDSVYDRLNEGKIVGIFPEGGSHDRTQLLPIKAGVSVMALGAMAKYPSVMSSLKIIPVGINYFNGHRFRSRVFVDIAEPIIVDPSLVEQFRKGGVDRKRAQDTLLEQVASGLSSVTVEASDFDHLVFLRAVRRLYKSTNHKASPEERMALMLAFSKGYKKDAKDPRVVELYQNVLSYRKRLKTMDISDHEVSRSQPRDTLISTASAVFSLLSSVLYLLLCTCLFLPGFIVIFPWRALTRYISNKKKVEAKQKSSVKIDGRDVVATWKLMTSICLIPIQHILYTFFAYLFGGESWGVGYFFFAPFLAMLTVKSTEAGYNLINSIKPLWLALISPESTSDLIVTRSKLKKNVRDLVSTLGWDKKLESNLGRKAVRRMSITSLASSDEEDGDFNIDLIHGGMIPSDDDEDGY
jgi:glycerol-3-phosphate O-acyltransferase / dihydroxyacetone phosphate acyltransferase